MVLDANAFGRDALEDRRKPGNRRVEVDGQRLVGVALREREEPPRELGAARGGGLDVLDPFGRSSALVAPQDIGPGQDDREQVVHVVRDAAGKTPDRLEPLGFVRDVLGMTAAIFGLEGSGLRLPFACRAHRRLSERLLHSCEEAAQRDDQEARGHREKPGEAQPVR
ncbi:MAG: hypothetical protein HOV80_19900 [Polyangiaceae bacterium]|nr:hypothetical protein [Polyangiaceae bacterium]